MKQANNPMLCDTESGFCEMPSAGAAENPGTVAVPVKPVRIIYFTDPICSSCWGIEPQLRRMKLEYAGSLDIEYRMGGLLPDWSYNSGGISKPSDVASHWDEVSRHYDMPIDGDVWLEDPLHSSYPPSIAFKAAEMQDKHKAISFLRVLREMVFLQKKNITRWEHLAAAAEKTGLDTRQLQKDYEGKANQLFQEDLALARQLGVRGFPTMFFIDDQGKQEKVYGRKSYDVYENVINTLYPSVTKHIFNNSWSALFSKYPTLTTREFAELSGTTRVEALQELQDLYDRGLLKKLEIKNGILWMHNGNGG